MRTEEEIHARKEAEAYLEERRARKREKARAHQAGVNWDGNYVTSALDSSHLDVAPTSSAPAAHSSSPPIKERPINPGDNSQPQPAVEIAARIATPLPQVSLDQLPSGPANKQSAANDISDQRKTETTVSGEQAPKMPQDTSRTDKGPVREGSSRVKGWVYVISNKAMPGLVKVGYSMKDPEIRAREFDNTAVPHPFDVDYEVLVDEPYLIEQRVHRDLSAKREGREWFRCTAEEAIAAITFVTEGKRHIETFKQANREEANHLAEERRREEDLRRKEATRVAEERKHAEELERAVANQVAQATSRVRAEYDKDVARQFPEIEFWPYWLGWGFGFLISLYLVFDPIKNDVGTWIAAAIAGAIAAYIHISNATEKRKKSPAYLALIQRRDATIQEVEDSIRRTLTYSDGTKYVGELRDGKQNGQGTYTWLDGKKYVGEWRDSKCHGQGTYTWSNGEKHVGEFKDGKRHGQGIEYRANGTILQSGIWENDVYVGAR